MMRADIAETIDRQNTIIRIQSRIIDDIFLMLAQHLTAQELDSLPVINRINEAAKLRADIGIGEVTDQ